MVTDRTAREPDMHNDDDSRPRAVSVVANERPSRASEPPSLRSRESSPVPPDSTLSRSQPESERWLGSVNPRKAPSRVRPRGGDGGITPRMTAVFGGLFGLATMASIFAMLIQVFPVETDAPPTEAAIAGVEEGATPGEPQSGAAKRQRVLLPGPWRVDKLADTHKMIRGTMDRRSFIKALTEAGVPTSEVYRIIKSLEGVRKFDRTGRKDKFTVAMSRSAKKAIAFEYEVSPTEIYQARTGDDGLLSGAKLDMKVRTEEFAVSFYIGSDLQRSYKAAGLEDGVLDVINAAFNGQTSTEAFEEGGVVKIIVVEMTALGRFVRYDSLRAIEYRPPDPAKEPTRAYWFQGEAKGGYVDERGRQPSKQGWRMPVPGAPVTSQFNPRRMHPVLKRVMPHNGTDFGAPSGTPVYAAFRGTVELVGRYGASGNLVTVIHPGGVTTGYAHLSRFAKGLKPQQKVGTRQLIGYVGSTGRSTAPHLHFSAKRDGKFFDALTLKLDALTLLPVAERGRFLEQKALLEAELNALPLPEPPEPEPAEPEPSAAAPDEDEPGDEGDEGDEGDDDPDSPDSEPEPASPPPKTGESDDDATLLGDDLSGDLE